MKNNKVYCGDNVEIMKKFPNECIDLTVTSPPYDNLRTYNGYSFDFENVAKELYRVTKKGGVVVWVVGDATIKGSETGTSFKQALYFKEIGFNLHDTMIFEKLNPAPFVHNRQEQAFEYMFVFSKGKPKTVNLKMKKNKSAGKKIHHHSFKHNGKKIKSFNGKQRETKEFGIDINIWKYKVGWNNSYTEKYLKKHPAIFPEKLAEDHILVWSNENETILDPFAGSGTTLKMARLNNRRYVGIDCSKEYCKILERRLCDVVASQLELFKD